MTLEKLGVKCFGVWHVQIDLFRNFDLKLFRSQVLPRRVQLIRCLPLRFRCFASLFSFAVLSPLQMSVDQKFRIGDQSHFRVGSCSVVI